VRGVLMPTNVTGACGVYRQHMQQHGKRKQSKEV
jgi:hypothetical protein